MCPLLLTQTEFLISWLICSKKNCLVSWYITTLNELVPWENQELPDLNTDIFQMRSLTSIYLDLEPMQALRFFACQIFIFGSIFFPYIQRTAPHGIL